MLTVMTHFFGVKYPIETVLQILKKTGIRKIELFAAHISSKHPSNMALAKEICAAYGIKIAGMVPDAQTSGGLDFTPYEAGKEQASVKHLENNVIAARALGAKYITMAERVAPPGVPEQEAWDRLVAVLKQGAKIAADNDIVLVNEFHPNMFASRLDRSARLIDAVDSPGFKACLDFCHAYVINNGDPVAYIQSLAGRIGHVHIADSPGDPGMHVPLGKGKVNWRACLKAVKATGYKGEYALCMAGYAYPEHALAVCARALKGLV